MKGSTVNKELNVMRELVALESMTVSELRKKHLEVFGEENNSRNKTYLVKRIIWRIQANAYGNLTDRALARARELARDSDLRTTAPSVPATPPTGGQVVVREIPAAKIMIDFLPAGACLKRQYKGSEKWCMSSTMALNMMDKSTARSPPLPRPQQAHTGTADSFSDCARRRGAGCGLRVEMHRKLKPTILTPAQAAVSPSASARQSSRKAPSHNRHTVGAKQQLQRQADNGDDAPAPHSNQPHARNRMRYSENSDTPLSSPERIPRRCFQQQILPPDAVVMSARTTHPWENFWSPDKRSRQSCRPVRMPLVFDDLAWRSMYAK